MSIVISRFFLCMVIIAVVGCGAPSPDPSESMAVSEAITPQSKIELFNGENLDGWTTWLVDTKQQDPRGGLFRGGWCDSNFRRRVWLYEYGQGL